MLPQRVYVATTVPQPSLTAVLNAIAAAGGGQIGHYTHCAFTNARVGRFRPGPNANPHTGTQGAINAVDKWRVETFCDRAVARAVLSAIRAAHPYEEPVFDILLLNEPDL
jgi:hypothetical protein